MVRITALMDNKPSENKALCNEHGLSYLVEGNGIRFLFDCGAGPHPWENAHRLGLDVGNLDAVVLSHSHYDHAAGYRDLLEMGGGSPLLYTGKRFFEPKFAYDGTKYTDLSAGFDRAFLEAHHVSHREVADVTELAKGVYLLSGFPRKNEFETIPERFVRLTDQGFVPDDFEDEICIALDVGGKLVILVGCSHPGILNMVEHVHKVLSLPVYGVFGGTHLVEADEARVSRTVRRLREMGVEILGLSHCSGEAAECAICRDRTVKSCHMGSGDCIFLDLD